jgi:hypothetical protein
MQVCAYTATMGLQQTTSRRPWVAPAASLVLVGVGVFLIKLCVFDVLAAARRHESISLNLKGVLIAPPVLVLGLIAVVSSFSRNRSTAWPARLSFSNPQTKRLSAFGWAFVFALLAVGGGVYFWLTSQLTALGYEV